MQKVHYDGPIEGAYVDGNFYALMDNLQEPSLLHNEDFPHPLNPKLIGFVVNVWNFNGVTVVYRSAYRVLEDDVIGGISAKVVLDGSEDKIGEVERKIHGGIAKGLAGYL